MMKSGKRILTRAVAIILAFLCLFSLCSCFDHNYNWDLPEREANDVNLELLMAALAGAAAGKEGLTSPETSSEVDPPVDPEPEDGIIMKLSLDGGHYIVAGASDTSAVELEIPEEYNGLPVTEIAEDAFRDMNTLEKISIPDSILHIGMNAFLGCTYLEHKNSNNFYYLGNDDNPYYALVSSHKDGGEYVNINGRTVVIADGVFQDTKTIKNLHIPNSVITVGDYAFKNCSALAEVEFGENVQYIGEGAFMACEALESVTIPDSVTTLGSGAFSYCNSLSRADIGDGIERMEANTFGMCSALASVVIGDNVKYIDNYAFDFCAALSAVTLPNSLEYIGMNAFSRCEAMNYYEFNNGFYLKFKTGNKLCLMDVKDRNIETLGMHYCTGVVAYGLLGSLEALQTIEIRSKNNYETVECAQYFNVSNNCLYISKDTYGKNAIVAGMNNSTITNYYGITEIDAYAFYGCNLKGSLRIPKGVTKIGDYAFFECQGLEQIYLNTALESIGNYAFSGCSAVTTLVIGDNLQNIGDSAFSACSSLAQAVVLPDSLRNIGSYAFAHCSSLPSIQFNEGLEYLGSNIVYKCDDKMDIYFNGSSLAWKNIENGVNFSTIEIRFVYCVDSSIKYG